MKKKIPDLKMMRVYRVVRADVNEADDIENNTYHLTVVDLHNKNRVLPCSRDVFLDKALPKLTNHFIDLYQDAQGIVVAADSFERNDFMNRMTPVEEREQDIEVVINPVTGLSSVRSRPYRVTANEVTTIKRLVDAAEEIQPRMLLGGRYEVKEIIDPGAGLRRLVLSCPEKS